MLNNKTYCLQAPILDIFKYVTHLFKGSVLFPLCLYNVVTGNAHVGKPNG